MRERTGGVIGGERVRLADGREYQVVSAPRAPGRKTGTKVYRVRIRRLYTPSGGVMRKVQYYRLDEKKDEEEIRVVAAAMIAQRSGGHLTGKGLAWVAHPFLAAWRYVSNHVARGLSRFGRQSK